MKVKWLFLYTCLVLPAALFAITIGSGNSLGRDRLGQQYFEEFQDWSLSDLKAVDKSGTTWDSLYSITDGYDDSRDIVAFYYREENSQLFFRIDFNDLRSGAESEYLNCYVTLDFKDGGQEWLPDFANCKTDHPWEAVICLYDTSNVNIYDDNDWTLHNSEFAGAYFNSQLDSVEFAVNQSLLTSMGWESGQAISFNVYTRKDNFETDGDDTSNLIDCIVDPGRGFDDQILNGAVSSTDQVNPAKLAVIFHGNQPIERNDNVNHMIYAPDTTNKTGFVRNLDTHKMFDVPVNIHVSGTLLSACQWADLGDRNNPSDGPAFIDYLGEFIDDNQASAPGSLIGGVWSEHIMPYFEGAANAKSIEIFGTFLSDFYQLDDDALKIMHVPERVIRQTDTGFTPLTGRTFDDITNSPYPATYLDEITHMHDWFYPSDSWSGSYGSGEELHQHKIHKVNGVYCFEINDREDQVKFWLQGRDDNDNADSGKGLHLDSRYTFLKKACDDRTDQLTLIFDDWEAYAGQSFGSGENGNATNYHYYVRWVANHPWIQMVNLKDELARATDANNAAYEPNLVIDHGSSTELPLHTYEWLEHASEDSYDNWYYNTNGQEQDFYNLVPVIRGNQGSSDNSGTPIPSGKKLGDMNTAGSLIADSWAEIQNAPDNHYRELANWFFATHIYETAWHDEDNNDYINSNYGNPWPNPDTSYDDLSRWVLRHQNHLRSVQKLTFAASWFDNHASYAGKVYTISQDLDMDGVDEYVLYNQYVLMIFEKMGGRCVLMAVAHPSGETRLLSPAILNRYTAPGEEEPYSDAKRCTLFKDATGDYYQQDFTVTVGASSIMLTSPDSNITRTISMLNNSNRISVAYTNNTGATLPVRMGFSPNILDLTIHGQSNLNAVDSDGKYTLNYQEGSITLELKENVSNNTSFENKRAIAHTDQVELLIGQGFSRFDILAGFTPETSVPFWQLF